MKILLSLKTTTRNPADGIDNFNRSIFGRLSSGDIIFYSAGDVVEKGAIKKIPGSVFGFFLKKKPDIIWGNGHIKDLPLVLFSRIFFGVRTKYIINFHTVLLRRSGPWGVRTPWLLRKFLFNRADMIICPSEFSANSVRAYFPGKKIMSILNGVDLALFDPKKKNEAYLAQKYGIDFSVPIAAFVGSLHARKRPGVFIALAKALPEMRFIAVGRMVGEFDLSVAADGLANVQWIPAMSREDVATLLASASAFIFPSLNDAAAAVILEAMASGAVPVVSESGGNGEFFRDGESGFLIKQNDSEEKGFLEKTKTLLKDSVLRELYSRCARQEAERHSWDAAAKQYKNALIP